MKYAKFGACFAFALLLIAVFAVPISACSSGGSSSGGNGGSDHCHKKVPKFEFTKNIDYSYTTTLTELAATGMVDEKYYPTILAQLPTGIDQNTEFTVHVKGVLSGCGTMKDKCQGANYDLRVTFDGSIDLLIYTNVVASLDITAQLQVKAYVADDLSEFQVKACGSVRADVYVMGEKVGYIKSCISMCADETELEMRACTQGKLVMNEQTVKLCMKSYMDIKVGAGTIDMSAWAYGTVYYGDEPFDLAFEGENSMAFSQGELVYMQGAILALVGA